MVKMQTRATTVTVVLVFFSTISCSNAQQPIREIDFDLDVRPILADRCYACHGPDEHSREADLRLDQPESALGTKDAGAAIVPGNPTRVNWCVALEVMTQTCRCLRRISTNR